MLSSKLGLICTMMVCFAMAIPIYGEEPQPSETSNTQNTVEGGDVPVLTLPQLKIEILKAPPAQCQRKTQPGDFLGVHFIGKIGETDTQFDSSYDRGMPFNFPFGVGQVIPGWDQGLVEMCVGEKRRLTIPPHLAYGDRGAGDKIPPKSTLVFEIELMTLQDPPQQMPPPPEFTPPPMRNVFKDIDTNGDKEITREEISIYIRNNEKQQGIPFVPEKEHNQMIDQIFEHEDTNKDGKISFDEFKGPKHDEL